MAAIERIAYCSVAIPLGEPIAFATGGVANRCFGLLKLTDRDGAVGLGYVYLGATPVTLVGTAVGELLAPVVLGEEAGEIEALWQRMDAATQLHGRAGSVRRAIALIDIALHDLKARRADVPLHRALGSGTATTVAAYAAGGYYGPGKGVAELSAELAELRALGFRAVKMKIGKFAVDIERQRVAAAREAVGADTELMLDANNSWQDLDTALRYLDALAPARPHWIEEPFVHDDTDRLRALQDRSGIAVATGENEANPLRFVEILRSGAAAVIQPDAMVCGGITPWLGIAASAAAYPVRVCPHAFHDLHVHLLAAIGPRGWLEFMPGERVMNFGRVITRSLEFGDGAVRLPTAAGLGFDFDETAIARHAVGSRSGDGPWIVHSRQG
ncbi:MAG: mandelate racemase/muconate lactonizing enzyme family protein [Lautropia sp.]